MTPTMHKHLEDARLCGRITPAGTGMADVTIRCSAELALRFEAFRQSLDPVIEGDVTYAEALCVLLQRSEPTP